MADRLLVVHHQRLPFPDHHSIERVFEAVRGHLPDRFAVHVAVAPTTSKGVGPRVRSALAARRQPADVHHVTGDVTFLATLLPRRRTVVTIHDCEFLDRAGWLKGLVYRIVWLQVPCLRAAVVTVVSPATETHLRRALWRQPRRIVVVPDPLPDGFAPSPAPGNDPVVVLQVGTRPNKNLDGVAQAVAGTGMRLRTVGVLDDAQRTDLADLDLDHEALAGLDDTALAAAYAGADVLVLASTHEGFGMPVLEAQATGRPVVVSDREPLPWVAGPGGAVVVDPTDPAAIRQGILDAVDPDRRPGLVAAGLANIERFAPATVAAAYAALYDEVAVAARRR